MLACNLVKALELLKQKVSLEDIIIQIKESEGLGFLVILDTNTDHPRSVEVPLIEAHVIECIKYKVASIEATLNDIGVEL